MIISCGCRSPNQETQHKSPNAKYYCFRILWSQISGARTALMRIVTNFCNPPDNTELSCLGTVAAPVGSVDAPAVPQVGPSYRKDAKIWRQAKMEAKSWRPYLDPQNFHGKKNMVKKLKHLDTLKIMFKNVEVWCLWLSRNDLHHCSQVTGGWSHRAQHRSTPCRFFRPFFLDKNQSHPGKKTYPVEVILALCQIFFGGGKQLRIQVWKHELWPTKINPQNFRDQWA